MSDPVTNVEIEDVLSSIRRLVSSEARLDEARPDEACPGRETRGDPGRSSGETVQASETKADIARSEPKLVLTPAQRVNDAVGPADKATHEPATDDPTDDLVKDELTSDAQVEDELASDELASHELASYDLASDDETHEAASEDEAVANDDTAQPDAEDDVDHRAAHDLSEDNDEAETASAEVHHKADAGDAPALDDALEDEETADQNADDHNASDQEDPVDDAPDSAALEADKSGEEDPDAEDLEAKEPDEHASDSGLLDMVADQITTSVGTAAVAELHDHLPKADEDDTAPEQTSEQAPEGASDSEDISFGDMSDPDVPEFLRRPITQMDPPEDAEVVDDAQSIETPDASDISGPSGSLTSRLQSLEEAVAGQAEDWEPDGGDQESLSAEDIEPLPWNEIEAEIAEMPSDVRAQDPYSDADPSTAQAEARAGMPPWFGEDATIDEEALRDMVGEIVRQELQGALGERITRNVRKLVRREIHRALMSQGLD